MGMAAHSMLPLNHPATASFALVLGAAGHTVGWPAIRGGSQRMTDVLAAIVRENGGEIATESPVTSLTDLPNARAVFLDTSPYAALRIAGDRLDPARAPIAREVPAGPAAFKLDYALSEPLPWKASDCARAGTVHIGGQAEEVVAAEAEVARGGHPERPFVLVAQQSIFDPTPRAGRTPHALGVLPRPERIDGRHDRPHRSAARTVRARVPRRRARAQHVARPPTSRPATPTRSAATSAAARSTGLQFVSRPRLALDPYRLAEGVYLCSASTPPGAGVHGMCAAAAVQRVLSGASSATDTRDHPRRWSGTRPIMAAWAYRTSRRRRARSPWAAGRSTSSPAPHAITAGRAPGTCTRRGPGRCTSRSSTPTAAARSSRCTTTTASR